MFEGGEGHVEGSSAQPCGVDQITLIDVPVVGDTMSWWDWAWEGMGRVQRAACHALFGNTDLAESVREIRSQCVRADGGLRLVTIAVSRPTSAPESVVGYSIIALPTDANRDLAEFYQVYVSPEWEDTEVPDRLLRRAEQQSTAHGRSTFVLYAAHGPITEDTPTITAPHGGRVATNAYEVQLGLRNGYEVVQAEWLSVLHLPVSASIMDPLWEKATSRNEGYRLVSWDVETPPELRRSYAILREGFSSLAPAGDLDVEEEVWDEERVVERDQTYRESGVVHARVAAQCVQTGELAGFTSLAYTVDSETVARQGITIILPEHRGHRLGLWMKLANIADIPRHRPNLERIYTDNAAENGPMLAINDALGFVPFGGSAAMRKRLRG